MALPTMRATGSLHAVYHRAPDGSEPVDAFVERLDIKRQVALDKQIRGELRELRCHYGRELYRVLYRRSRNLVVLLHAFRKDTGTIPEREIQIAQERWADFARRMDAPRRRPPRAAGHDAP